MNLTFSPARWGRLLVHRLTDSVKPLGMACAVVTGVQLAAVLLTREPGIVASGGLWTVFVLLAALFTAASAFRPMHEGRSAADWLLWPATSTEKWAAAAAEVLAAVPLGLMVASSLGSALVSLVSGLASGAFLPVWFPWNAGHTGPGGELVVLLLVFFAGSAAFRKNALWKTGLLLVAAGLGFALVSMVILRTTGVLGSLSWNSETGLAAGPLVRSSLHLTPGSAGATVLEWLGRLWFFAVVPAFSLAFSWSKVREKEARDEVQ